MPESWFRDASGTREMRCIADASRGASEGARGPSMVAAANAHRGLRARQAGEDKRMIAGRRQRNRGFEEETEEEGRAVTGYGIPA